MLDDHRKGQGQILRYPCGLGCAAAQAALARLIKVGCNTPTLGVCPCDAANGTLNHASLYGSSTGVLEIELGGIAEAS